MEAKWISSDEAESKISNFYFSNINSGPKRLYILQSCLIKVATLQEAVDVARRVQDGISKDFLARQYGKFSWKGEGCYTVDNGCKFYLLADEKNDCAGIFTQVSGGTIYGTYYTEAVFALWRRDDSSFFFQLIERSKAGPNLPYARLLLNKVENKTVYYSQSAKGRGDYKVVLDGSSISPVRE